MTDRKTHKRRLEGAGYTYASGWLSSEEAQRVREWAEHHREDVERIAAESKPRGRPRKEERT